MAPPVNGLDGVDRHDRHPAGLSPCGRLAIMRASWLTREDFPVPGAPVTPIRWALPVWGKELVQGLTALGSLILHLGEQARQRQAIACQD